MPKRNPNIFGYENINEEICCIKQMIYMYIMVIIITRMSKQNQLHEHLYRPFPSEDPECKHHDTLSLSSNCSCPPCQTRPNKIQQQIQYDTQLHQLMQKKNKSPNKNKVSDIVIFLDQIHKNAHIALPNIPILDTIVFNSDGNVRYIVGYQNGKFRISRLGVPLKNYLNQRKHTNDLQYQKKKYQHQNMGFSFTQLDNQSEKLIKQFETNIKYINPLLNRVLINKLKSKQSEQILTQNELNTIFTKISRKLYDFTNTEYLQIFPVMYSHEESSYVRKIKYFRYREIQKKNFKIAEHYVGNWCQKNTTLEDLEQLFISTIKHDEDQYLLYFTYKLFIFFQMVSNKMVECALLTYITNDQGHSFYLKNIQCLNLFSLHEVAQRAHQLPRKLQDFNPETDPKLNLRSQMKDNFQIFQRNYERLQRQRKDMQQKRQNDINFSNRVYQSLGKQIPHQHKSSSFIKSIFEQYSQQNKGKIILEAPSQKYTQNSKQL